MSKIVNTKVICACCGNKVNIDRILSFSYDKTGLSGNKYSPMQYKMEECPECHYTSFDISDNSVRATKGMLNAFRMKSGTEKITDPIFCSILKAADIYEKNKDYLRYEYSLRLASFYAEELQEISVSRNLLRQANVALQQYFEEKDVLDTSDIMLAVHLIDGNRRLGMTETARSFSMEIIELIKDTDDVELLQILRLVEFEITLLENRDIAEHVIDEVL